ncbi:DUF2339 domain-containing protein [Ancylobacter terrae]|uniref:DUF2339 domain-containing protein n=1 Tax=Ancylobacter sp. sgz301288 TaxID=3342077 RepID=UPI00385F7120
MDGLSGLLLLVALILIFRLRGRVKRLELRLAALETGSLVRARGAEEAPATPVAPESRIAPEADATAAASPPGEVVPMAARKAAEPDPAASATAGPADSAPETAKGRARPLAGFEERFGALWTVWLGGLALALGGIFLVRYAIEADLIGPGVRLALGGLLALFLLGLGEWLRRSDRMREEEGITRVRLPFADVPAMLTAAGTSTAYAVVYAGYELYGMLPPPLAFGLLGLVAAGCMLAALLHGPMLAALGLVGAGVAPLLVASAEPSAWGLAVYVAMVAAAAFALARVRLWAWLAALAAVGALLWGLVLIAMPETPGSSAAAGFLAAALMALTGALLVPGLLRGPPAPRRARPDWLSLIGIAGALVLGALLTARSEQAPAALILFAVLGVAAVAMAARAEAAMAGPLIAGLGAAFVLAAWDVLPTPGTTVAAPGAMEGVVAGPPTLAIGGFVGFGLGFGGLLALSGFIGARRSRRLPPALAWSAAATIGPLLMLIAGYWRLAGFERSFGFAALALLLALLAMWAVDRLSRQSIAGMYSGAAFAAGAVGALALGLTMALERGWLTVGLALASLGIAWVWSLRPLPGLRALSALVGVSVLGRIVWDPAIAGGDPGPGLVINWLLWGYGVPAAAFALAAWKLGGGDWARRTHDSLALMFAVLLAVTEIRHWVHGDLLAPAADFAEIGGYLCVALAYAIGLERLRRAGASPVHQIGSLVMFAAAGALALVLLTALNPAFTGDPVGGRLVNLLLLGYGLPALLAFGLNVTTAGQRGIWHRRLSGTLALVLALAYLTLQVRRLFVGESLDAFTLGDTELYAYSAVWLGFGIALLVAGLVMRSGDLRLASAVIVLLTIAKVFLWDMADLTGALRALSFIGLGLVLVGIGWLYQNLLLRRREDAAEPS